MKLKPPVGRRQYVSLDLMTFYTEKGEEVIDVKEAKIANWIALVWTLLGSVYMLGDQSTEPLSVLYMLILIIAQILAIRIAK